MAPCSGIKADGGRCRAQAMHGSEWCVGHDPDKAEARRLRASKGGRRGGRGRPRAELQDVKRRLSDLADDVLDGKADKVRAAVAGQLLNALIRAVFVETKVREVEDLERRLEELEGVLEGQRGVRRGAYLGTGSSAWSGRPKARR